MTSTFDLLPQYKTVQIKYFLKQAKWFFKEDVFFFSNSEFYPIQYILLSQKGEKVIE